MKVDFLEFKEPTEGCIYGVIRRTYSDTVSTVIGVMAVKYPSMFRSQEAVVALNHIAAPVDDDDAYPCELLETHCRVVNNERLSRYLEAHEFSVKSILIYYGMREDETT